MPKIPKLDTLSVLSGLLLLSNTLILFFCFIFPPLLNLSFSPRLMQFLAMPAVYPYDFYHSYLSDQWFAQVGWIIVVLLCAGGLLKREQWARMVLIVLCVMHIVILFFIVAMMMKDWYLVKLQYLFRFYFNLVAVATYVGFLTLPEIRGQFSSVLVEQTLRRWLNNARRRSSPQVHAQGCYNLGLAYRRLERYQDAVKFLVRAVEQNPRERKYLVELGRTYFIMKDWPDSVRWLLEAVRLDPIHVPAYLLLGRAYLNQGCAREAAGVLVKASHADDKNGEVYYYLGVAYQSGGQPQAAAGAFVEAARKGYASADLYFRLGQLYLDPLERYDDAGEAFRKAGQLDDGLVEAYFLKGLAALKGGHNKDALWAFKEVLARDPDHKQAHYQLGFSYARLGDAESALREYHYLRGQDAELAETLRLAIE